MQGRERHPAIGQRVDSLHQMPQRPAQPVQPPHHQRVAGSQIPQAQAQLRPFSQFPDAVSAKIFSQPAAFSASVCPSRFSEAPEILA
jgi:hypothetical protein